MEKNNINVVLYIDSDVLLYVDDIEKEYKKSSLKKGCSKS